MYELLVDVSPITRPRSLTPLVIADLYVKAYEPLICAVKPPSSCVSSVALVLVANTPPVASARSFGSLPSFPPSMPTTYTGAPASDARPRAFENAAPLPLLPSVIRTIEPSIPVRSLIELAARATASHKAPSPAGVSECIAVSTAVASGVKGATSCASLPAATTAISVLGVSVAVIALTALRASASTPLVSVEAEVSTTNTTPCSRCAFASCVCTGLPFSVTLRFATSLGDPSYV